MLAGIVSLLTDNVALSQNSAAKATILDVKNGTATLQGRGSRPRPAKRGTTVYFGDLIRPSRGAIVLIRCSDIRREVRSISGLGDICPDTLGQRWKFGNRKGAGSL